MARRPATSSTRTYAGRAASCMSTSGTLRARRTAGPGFHVYTPLETPDKQLVLVNRGFVPASVEDPSQAAAGQVAGEVALTGLVRRPTCARIVRAGERARAQQVLVLARLSGMLKAHARAGKADRVPVPFFVDADAEPASPGGFPRGGATRLRPAQPPSRVRAHLVRPGPDAGRRFHGLRPRPPALPAPAVDHPYIRARHGSQDVETTIFSSRIRRFARTFRGHGSRGALLGPSLRPRVRVNPATSRCQRKPHPLRYVSTRGEAPELSFEDALLAGLARDGGLYVPKTWPQLVAGDDRRVRRQAVRRGRRGGDLEPFTGGCIPRGELRAHDRARPTPASAIRP